MISDFIKFLCRFGWAPIAVLILHAVVARTPLREPLDFWIHFSGGMAIAYFLFHAINHYEQFVGAISSLGHYLFTFALACTIGMFWEFAELLSDVFLGTNIQHTLRETMSDLIADTTGAFTSLVLVGLARCLMKMSCPHFHTN
jgi:hypothetical protein